MSEDFQHCRRSSRKSQRCFDDTPTNLSTIDPFHKCLPIKNSFVSIKISLTKLPFYVDNSKELFLPNESSEAN